jgi:hypothetical protein
MNFEGDIVETFSKVVVRRAKNGVETAVLKKDGVDRVASVKSLHKAVWPEMRVDLAA